MMMTRRQSISVFLVMIILPLLVFVSSATSTAPPPPPPPLQKKLMWHYYKVTNTCENAEPFIQYQIKLHWTNDPTITPKLLRLLYSDCFVTGCDGSILLDGPNSEKNASQNWGLGGFVIIDKIKQVLEARCPGVVSCADILNLATRDALHLAGAPSYPVLTGRRDGLTSSKSSVDLPLPSISWEASLAYFKTKGLNVLDMTTLLGSHSMGKTHCRFIVDRLYNFNNTGKPDPGMNSSLLVSMRKLCPIRSKKGQTDPLVYLNSKSGANYTFTNSYYSNVLSNRAVLGIDQQLLFGEDTKDITDEFAAGFEDFRRAFAFSMSRMGAINVLTGNQGEIRRNCRVRNS